MWFGFNQLLLLTSIISCVGNVVALNYSQHGLFWGGTPDIDANIVTTGSWVAIEGASVVVDIDHSSAALVSYDMIVEGLRMIEGSPLPREGNADTVQVRCTVDGIPFRYSSSFALTYLVEQIVYSKLSSSFVANMTAGSHNITLQWKKTGASILKWRVSSTGVNSGFSMSVLADSESISYLHEMNDVYLYAADTWKPLTQNLSFSLSTTSSVSIGYSFIAQPQTSTFIKDRNYEYVTSRILVDGVAYTDGSESRGTSSWNPLALGFKGTLTLPLSAGKHTTTVQWRKMGSVFKSWGSSPSYLDGFASSRNLFVLVNKFEPPVIDSHERQIFHGSGDWLTVNNQVQYFKLVKESAVLITYALPVSQFENFPNYDADVWIPLSRIDARLLVDNIPYTYTGGDSIVSTARTMSSLFGTLPLVLPAGTHSIALQWRAPTDFNWTTLMDLDDGFAHGEKLLTYITSENAKPVISAPDVVYGEEDVLLGVLGVQVSDVDELLSPGMKVRLNITVLVGTLTFPNLPLLASEPEFVHGADSSSVVFLDTIANINAALTDFKYQSPQDWNGNDTLYLTLSDEKNLGFHATALQDEHEITVVVAAVDDQFIVTTPAYQEFPASGELSFEPIGLMDVDSPDSVFRVQMSLSCGFLYFQYTDVTFLMGDGVNDTAVDFQGVYEDVVAALANISYGRDPSCNSMAMDNFAVIKVMNTDNLAQNVTVTLPLVIERINAPPEIISDDFPRFSMSGLLVDPTRDVTDVNFKYTQYPIGIVESVDVGAAKDQLVLRNKFKKSSMSELSVLESESYSYMVSLQYQVIPITMVTSSYLLNDTSKTVVLMMDPAYSNAGFNFSCVLNTESFNAVQVVPGIVECDVSYLASSAEVSRHRPVWIQLIFSSLNASYLMRSSYLPLFLTEKVVVSSVSPSRLYSAGQSVVRVSTTNPAVVEKCFFDSFAVDAVISGGDIVCRAPIFEITTQAVSSFRIGSDDKNIISEAIELTLFPSPVVSFAWFETLVVVGSLSNSVQLVIQGNWKAAELEYVHSAVCVAGGIRLPMSGSGPGTVYCEVDFNSWRTLKMADNVSVLVQFDSQASNAVSVTAAVVSTSSEVKGNVTVDDFYPRTSALESSTITVYGHSFLNSTGLKCVFGSVVSEPMMINASQLMCDIPLGANATDTLSIVNSADNNSVVYSGAISIISVPQVASIAPSRGMVSGGDEIIVFGSKFDSSLTFECLFGQDKRPAVWLSESTLSCMSPPHAVGEVSFTLLCDSIFAASAEDVQFSFISSPTVYSISPSTSLLEGGQLITVTGVGFLASEVSVACDFGGAIADAQVVSDTLLTCFSPAVTAIGIVNFYLVSGGIERSKGSMPFRYVIPMVVNSVSPLEGSSKGGTNVAITGLSFVQTVETTCVFGDVVVLARVSDSQHLDCIAPVSTPGGVSLSIVMDNTIVLENVATFTFTLPLELESLTPTQGTVNGNTTVLVKGSGFNFFDEYSCRFGEYTSPAEFVSSTEMMCRSPIHPYIGTVAFSLINSYGVVMSNVLSFSYVSGTVVSSITPAAGPLGLESLVTVTGSGFFQPRPGSTELSEAECVFGDVRTIAVALSDNILSCLSPLSVSEKTVKLNVYFNNDKLTEDVYFYRFVKSIVVTDMTPRFGWADRETVVVVKASSFSVGSQIECLFNDTATLAQYIDENTIQCSTPVGLAGKVPVSISVNGYAFTTDMFFTSMPEIEILSIFPSQGSSLGGTNVSLAVSGVEISDVLHCWFGNSVVPASLSTDNVVTCVSPSQEASTVSVMLQVNGVENVASTVNFTFTANMVVDSIVPNVGSMSDLTRITVFGSGFTADSVCLFGETEGSVVFHNSSVLTCTAFAEEPGPVLFKVTNDGGDISRGDLYFQFLEDCYVSSVYPREGSTRGSTSVVVEGGGFSATQYIECVFGSMHVEATVINSTNLMCVSPSSDEAGSVALTLSVDGQQSIESGVTFKYISTIELMSLWPTAVSTHGGTNITIYGSGFTADVDLYCQIDGSVVVADFVSDSSIVCLAPSHTLGEASLGILSSQGVLLSEDLFSIEFVAAATITSVVPTSGFIVGGEAVVILGSGFNSCSGSIAKCVFGNTSVDADIISDSEIQCLSPSAETPGSVSLQVTVNEALVNGGVLFIYFSEVSVSSCSPSQGVMSGGSIVTVFGQGFSDSLSLKCSFGEALSTAFFVNSTAVRCLSPVASIVGPVKVTLDFGMATSIDSSAVFTYIERQSGLQMSPSTAFASGGQNLTLTGLNVSENSFVVCRFDGTDVSALFVSADTVKCVSPSLAVGSTAVALLVDDVVVNQDSLTLTVVEDVVVYSIAPVAGFTSGGNTVSVIGVGFALGSNVVCRFGNQSSAANVESNFALQCEVPATESVGSVEFNVVIDDQEVSLGSIYYRYIAPVSVFSVSPSRGSKLGGTAVHLSGDSFSSVASIVCAFGDVEVESVYLNSTLVMCEAPQSNAVRETELVVKVNGVNVSEGLIFTYLPPVALHSVTPVFSSTLGGGLVTLTGSGFDEELTHFCVIDNVWVLATVESLNRLTCVLPTHAEGLVSVQVVSADGSLSSSELTLEYGAFPTVASLSPVDAKLISGEYVTVNGWKFEDEAMLTCKFDNVTVVADLASDVTFRCMIPDGLEAGSNVVFEVKAFGEIIYSKKMMVFSRLASIGAVVPNYAAVNSAVGVRFVGSQFETNCSYSCVFGEVSVNALVYSDTELLCTTPIMAAASSITLSIEQVSLGTLYTVPFTFVEVPVLLSGSVSSKYGVLLSVSKVAEGFEWNCIVDGLLFSSIVVNESAIICNVPSVNLRQLSTVAVSLLSDDGYLSSNSIDLVVDQTSADSVMCTADTVYSPVHLVCVNPKAMPLQDKVIIDRSWFRKSSTLAPRATASMWSVDYDSLPPLPELSSPRNAFISNVADTSNVCTVNSIDSCFTLTDSLDSIVFNTSRKSLKYVNNSDWSSYLSGSDDSAAFIAMDGVYPTTLSSLNGTWVSVHGSGFTNFTKCYLDNSVSPLVTTYVQPTRLECYLPPLSAGSSMVAELSLADENTVSLNKIALHYDFFDPEFKNFIKGSNDSSSITISSVARDTSDNLCASKSGCETKKISEDHLCSFVNNGNDTTTWMTFQDVEAFGTSNLSFCQNQQASNVAMQCRSNISESNKVKPVDSEISAAITVDVLLMEPSYLPLSSLADSMVTFMGTGFSASSSWCLSIESQMTECIVIDLTLSCMFPENLRPGVFAASLLRDCSEEVFSQDITLVMDSPETDSVKSIETPILVSVFPLTGSVNGGSSVSVRGTNVDGVIACVFVVEDKTEYVSDVVSSTDDVVMCSSPAVLSTGVAQIVLILSDSSRMTTEYFYRYFDVPEVYFFALDANTNNSVIVTGTNFPLSQSFCNLTYSDGSSVLSVSDAISTSEVRCIGTLRYHFSTRVVKSVGISFNGVDFHFTDNFVSLNRDSSMASVENLLSEFAEPTAYTADQGFEVEELIATPTVLSMSCDSNFRANLYVAGVEQSSNYSCFLGDEFIGRAEYLTANMLGCAIDARPPGTYDLSVLRQDSGLAGTFNFPHSFVLECGSRPKIYSGALVPQSKVDGKWEVRFSGVNIEDNSGLSCRLNGVLSSAAVDSGRLATCLFDPIAPGFHSIVLYSDSVPVIEYNVCFTAAFVRDGGDFSSMELTKDTCIGDVLIAKAQQSKSSIPSVVREIRSFAPRSGLTSGGTAVEVLVDGVSYRTPITCEFGDATVPGVVVSRDRVVCYSPSQAPGNVTLTLRNRATGDRWAGGWYYFYPLVSLLEVTPAVIDSRGGSLLKIQTRNRLESNVRYHCHINSLVVPAYVISDFTVSCITPIVTLASVNVSLGSLYEPWSDSLNLMVSGFGVSSSLVVPSHGSIFGGTKVILTIPQSYSTMKSPQCLFGKANATHARILSATSLVCEAPSNSAGLTQVSVFDAFYSNSPVFFVGLYTYEVPAEITVLSPNIVNQGENIDVLVFGTNFMDSPELSCILHGSHVIPARWLSSSMVLCNVPGDASVSGLPIQVHVSNNGHDMSELHLFLEVIVDNSIRSVSPTRSFTTGGTEVAIVFRQDFEGMVNCRFGGAVVSTAYQVESDTFICVSPSFEVGATSLDVLDAQSGFVLHSVGYEFERIPGFKSSRENGAIPIVLTGVKSPVSWTADRLSEKYFARVRSLNGSIAESECAVKESEFTCMILTKSKDEILFLDLSVNNKDFISAFVSMQVFQPSEVQSIGPLAVPAAGGVILSVEVDQFKAGVVTHCMFTAGDEKWNVAAVVVSNTTGLCDVPSLPLSVDCFVLVEQNGIVVFGPSSLEVVEAMIVRNVFPTTIFTGVLSTVQIEFLHPVAEYPARECLLEGVRSDFQFINTTFGVCTVQPIAAGNMALSLHYIDDLEGTAIPVERLKVIDVPSDFSLSDDTILEFTTTNVTITSKQCVFPPYAHCYIPALATVSHVTPCELVCTIASRQDFNSVRLDVCDTPTCDSPLYTQTLRVLPSVSVVTAYPSSGPVQGFVPVTLYGSGFSNDDHLECQFGNATSRAVVLTSATLSCQSPPAVPGVVRINVLRRGKAISKSVVTFEYFPLLSQFTLSTVKIASIGGTRMTITTQKLNFLGPFECRFNEKYVPVLIISETTLQCESPSFDIPGVEFALSVEHSDVSPPRMLQIIPAPAVLFVDPAIVVANVPSKISVWFGESVMNASIQCRMDGLPVATEMHMDDLMCVLPFGLSQGDHSLSLVLNGAEFSSYPIISRSPYAIQSVVPLTSSSDFATTVTVSLTQQDSGADFVNCCFGSLLSPAMLVSGSVWQCNSPLVTFRGNNSAMYPVGLARSDGFCEYSGFDFKIYKLPEVTKVTGSAGSTAGGTAIILEFREPLEMDIVYCRVALSVFLGQILDPHRLLCITPDPPAATAGIEISVNGVDFVQTNVDFSFTTVTPSNEIATESSGPDAVIYFASPTTVGSSSQAVVKVFGAHLRTGSTCMLGTLPAVTALSTSFVSEGEIDCTMPVHAIGSDSLYIRSVEGTYSSPMTINFIAASAMSSNLLTSISPLFGPIKTTTVITVQGVNLDLVNGLLCVIGSDYSYAFHVTNTSCSCTVPTALYPGNVTVQLANVYKEVLPNSAVFTYIKDAEVINLNPKKGTFDTRVIVTGSGFSTYTNLICLIGDREVETHVLSDTEVLCVVPVMDAGTYSVTFQTNGQHPLTSGLVFLYQELTKLTRLYPFSGPSMRGNTTVSVYGSGFTNSINMFCIFDTSFVPAVYRSEDRIECITPAHAPGYVNVSVMSDGSLVHLKNGSLLFLYTPDVSVYKITPEFGYTSGEFPVFVFGSNFLNTTGLGCQFADMKSRGVFLTESLMVCLAPSPLGRPELFNRASVTLEVTVNGADYSNSGIQFAYSQPCDQGFFCPGMTRQLCPNGTYCPVNSRNFTLCEPGTFQPKEGQTGCALCPIGYICPDHGMSRPVNCPPGLICDSMGLRTSAKLCPAGQYCLNGTKAFDVDAFNGSVNKLWVTDYVTGVKTFNLSAQNWDYTIWPYPAVGKSRSQHPPEPACDGLVCYPGTTNVLAEAPFPCPIGHYCRAGVGTQIPMPKNFSSPQRCFDGFYCPRGSKSPEGSGPCPNGYFCPTQIDAILCPVGHYCPGVGNRDPIECYPGTYNALEGQANCTVCPAGFICPGWGVLLPEPCPAGFVCMALGVSYPVVQCPQGYRCEEGTRTLDPSSPTIYKPIVCLAGQFCLGGVAATTTIEWIPSQSYGGTHPQVCSEGTYCQSGAYLSSGSGLCFEGHYCPPNSSFPISTPLGNFASGLGSVAPTLCYPGTYAPLIAQVDCLLCPSGNTCTSYGTYIPSVCEAGTYRSQVDSVTCTQCPTGTYSFEVGSPDLSLCLPCPKGRICGVKQMTTLALSSYCPPGYICGYGTDRSSQFQHLTPAGFHTAQESSPDQQYDSVCQPGYYCPRGTPTYLQYGGKCPVGYYCPQSTPAAITADVKCPVLTTSLSALDTLQGCRISEINVCDKSVIDDTKPMEDTTYYSSYTYTTLDDTNTVIAFDSSLSAVSPTGEIQVVRKIYPTNISASSEFWQNDTIEAFRTCPQYGSADGKELIMVIGRNFRDSKLNYCKFRACNSANLGQHPRRCKNQVKSAVGDDLDKAGNVSMATFITRARYISPTRMECETPEFIFDYDFHPRFEDVNYNCSYVNNFGVLQEDATMGNYSYVRQCGKSDTNCLNLPFVGLEYFTETTFPCTAEESLSGICADKPELGYMFNPCMTGEVIVEVTNDGEHYSGGVELKGTQILSTVRYGDGNEIYNNFKNFTVPATFAVFTYVYREFWYQNPDVLLMERKYCGQARYSEESEREREKGWFKLQLQEAAHMHVDFSFLPDNLVYGEHYRMALFMLPSRCAVEICSSARVRLSPEEFLPCRNPAEFSYWFQNAKVYNVKNNITIYALDDLIFKLEIHILNGLYAAYQPLFKNTSIVRIASPSRTTTFDGLPMEKTATRKLSQYISFEEQRITAQYFFCAVVYFTDTLTISQALNLPPTYSDYETGRALIMYNVSTENSEVEFVKDLYNDVALGVDFWLMPATTADNSKELLDAYFETFHDTTYLAGSGYVFDFQTLLIGYLPYFSNCHTFDSYIPIWLLLEGKECALPDIYPKSWHRYKFPALPDQDDVVFVGPFDFLAFPVADWCERTLTCHYEEVLAIPDSTPRWFEVSTGTALFQMIRYPMSYENYTGRTDTHIGVHDAGGGKAVTAYLQDSGDNFIDVSVDHSIGDLIPGCVTLCFARSYLMTISYYQLDLHNKKIISITLAGDAYDFDSTNTEYELAISYQALGFIDLVLNFAFQLSIFIVMFLVLGVATALVSFIGWAFCRATTLLQNPPQLRIVAMLALVVPPALGGVTIAVILIWILTSFGNYCVNGVFFTDPNSPETDQSYGLYLDKYHLAYANIDTQFGDGELELARSGRIGSVFLIVGFCCFLSASKMYFPKEESKREREIAKKRTDLAHKREIWDPVLWKKANFMFSSVVFSLILVLVVEFSFWGGFGDFFYSILIMFIIFGEVLVVLIEAQLQDKILVAPLNAGYGFATQLVTFGSPDFLAFLLSYFLGFAMASFQRVFQNFYMDAIFGAMKFVIDKVISVVRRFIPKYLGGGAPEVKEEAKEFKKRDVDGVAETGEDAESVEPIIDYFCDICSDTMILFYFPYFVYLFMQFRDQIQIPIIYGIRQSDMMIYLVFQLFSLVSQPLVDVFNHAQCELFHGWKIYEYLVYSRYRFLQRETRWKGMENSLDECIEEGLRKLDQMCFSSQYYLMLTAQVNGIIYLILAFECWLRVGYSPFSDSGFFILLGFIVGLYVVMEWVVVALAIRLKVWKIKHENTAWHLIQKEEDELDIPGWDDVKGASTEAYVMNQRITSETFRYKFLNYNRTWLINQLPQLLTPRTMRRSRPYLINQFARIINAKREDISDDSDKDKEKKFGPVALTAPSRNIIRWWLGKARRRLRLRSIVDPLIKRARGAQCEQCLSRKQLQIEYEVDIDKMAEMYDRTYPGDEEVDQVQWKSFWVNNQRYHTICLACLTRGKELATRNALKGADATLFDDDQEDYPDWGPVFLTAASKAMLLNWYRKAQRLRAGKRGRRQQKVAKAISDDEGEDVPLQWLKDMAEITPSTHAIAIKWMRTARARLQKKAGRGYGEREVKDEVEVAPETFKSGNKSRVMKK